MKLKKITIHVLLLFVVFNIKAQNVIRGPYLQKGSATSMTIKWRTSSSTTSKVEYGTNLSNLSEVSVDNGFKTNHEIQINGLSPDTKYYYRISNNNSVLVPASNDLYFQTHPTIGTETAMKIWVLGDCGTANSDQRAVRDAYYNYTGGQHTDAILFLGDNAYNSGTDSEYQNAVFQNMYENKLKNTISWSCLGNHDGYTADAASQTGPYFDIFSFPTNGESGGVPSGTEAYYSFDYGNAHFISLESYETDRSVGGAMYSWLENDLQNTTQDWIIAYWHHPAYTKGSHDSDTESRLIEMRQNFVPLLESYGVDLILSGHSHSYERSYYINGHHGYSNSFNSNIHTVGNNGDGDGRLDGDGAYQRATSGNDINKGMIYITAGSSGKKSGGSLNHEAMYYSVSELGSCLLEIDGDQLDLKFIRENGNVIDYFTIQKNSTNPINDFLLENFTSSCGTFFLPEISIDLSGIGYSPDTEKFYTVKNTGGSETLYVLDKFGAIEKTIDLNGFQDTEAIVYLGNNQFAITEERRRRVVFVTIDENTGNTINYPANGYFTVVDSGTGSNNGFEGITYNPTTDVLYIGKEGDQDNDNQGVEPKIYKVTNPINAIGTTINNPVQAFSNLPVCNNFDIAGLSITPSGNLLILSETCETIFEVDATTGAVLSELSIAQFGHPEGVVVVSENEMWVVGESYEIGQYVVPNTPCNTDEYIGATWDTNCGCNGGVPIDNGGSTTVCKRVNSSNDDVEQNENTGGIYGNSSDLELVYDEYQNANNQTVGIRFNNIDVPKGATITNAYLQFTAKETHSGATNLTIIGEASDNAGAFSNNAYTLNNRPKTTASVNWSPPAWNAIGQSGAAQKSPNIASIINEIVNRDGYNQNNSIALFISGTGERSAVSHDGNPNSAPELCISYTLGCTTEGDACDDNNPNTENDIYQSDCVCMGTPISKIQAKVFLEGFFNNNNGLLKNTNHFSLIPNSQPFNTAPWNYNGNESVTNIPTNAVDWILLVTRDANGNIQEQKAGFISITGEIMGTDGSMGISFNNASTYFSIHHKSHLAVMSSSAYTSGTYDFTNNINQAMGTEQMVLQNGKYMMYSGDYDCNGIINNIDYNNWKTNGATLNQYLNVDGDGKLDIRLYSINNEVV